MKKLFAVAFLFFAINHLNAQVRPLVNFQFTANPTSWEGGPVAGWVNVQGDPYKSVITVTDSTSHITISSIATTNWYSADSTCAADRAGDSVGPTYFPPLIMIDHWYQYSTGTQAQYNALLPQLKLSGLNKDSSYILRMSGSYTSYIAGDPSANPTQYTVAGRSVYPSQSLNMYNNTTQGITFLGVRPDSTGVIRIYINTTTASQRAMIAGLQVISGSANVGVPQVAFTKPTSGTILPEGTNLVINATAFETGSTIARVDFYADTARIATLTNAPYTFTWLDPDPRGYTLTAKATDNIGTVGSASIAVAIDPLNYFWSTTGNAATGGDTNFVGTVDSNRLSFRTKNVERMSISATGTVRLKSLKNDSTNTQPRMLVSDTSGNLYYRSLSSGGLNAGEGLGQTSVGLAIGDSIPGPGPHSFNSNRYQYLNGHMYSIGGSVNDPVNHPGLRVYDNGDLAVGTTMDTTANVVDQSGLRYYSKLGIMQIGSSDRLDTTVNRIVYSKYQGSGILMNSDDPNILKGRIYGTYFAGDQNRLDSGMKIALSLLAGEANHIGQEVDHSLILGQFHAVSGYVNNSIVSGGSITVTKQTYADIISGYGHMMQDTSYASLIGGTRVQFGGLGQLACGQFLINRSPYGTVLGNGNVDFATLPYTGLKGTTVANLGSYPLFALGNSSDNGNSGQNLTANGHSNAFTVLYNGRTQINTTGLTNTLAQTDVTPKAALDVVSTTTGVLLPRLTTSQRNAIVSTDLQNGLLLYNTDSSSFQYYNGSAWNSVGTGGTASGRWMFGAGIQFDTVNSIGIGTNNTLGYKLAVNGTAIFTKIKVKPFGLWPDYVFSPRYKLPSLGEVERYISANHHLPGILSETEVQLQGIDLGDHAASMLKKVEELTLYLIQQNKTIATQEEQLDSQAKQLAEQQARLNAMQKDIDQLKALINAKK